MSYMQGDLKASNPMRLEPGADTLRIDASRMAGPNEFCIYMTRGKREVRDRLMNAFGGGIERVVISVDGERHVYDADALIRLLERYEEG